MCSILPRSLIRSSPTFLTSSSLFPFPSSISSTWSSSHHISRHSSIISPSPCTNHNSQCHRAFSSRSRATSSRHSRSSRSKKTPSFLPTSPVDPALGMSKPGMTVDTSPIAPEELVDMFTTKMGKPEGPLIIRDKVAHFGPKSLRHLNRASPIKLNKEFSRQIEKATKWSQLCDMYMTNKEDMNLTTLTEFVRRLVATHSTREKIPSQFIALRHVLEKVETNIIQLDDNKLLGRIFMSYRFLRKELGELKSVATAKEMTKEYQLRTEKKWDDQRAIEAKFNIDEATDRLRKRSNAKEKKKEKESVGKKKVRLSEKYELVDIEENKMIY